MDDFAPTTRTLCPIRFVRAAAIAGLAAAIALGGCDSFNEEMSGLTTPFKQVSPAEGARMAVDPTDADKRREGILLLSNAPFGGVEVYVEFYRDAVKNEREPIVKSAAIQALGRHGDPADALLIAPLLADDNQQVRWAAALALQRLHNPAVTPELLRALANEFESQDVRIAAATALGQYPEDRVFQGLVGALNARELAVNEAADQSLRILTNYDFQLDAGEWLEWYALAVKTNSAFAEQQQFLYPVYQRKLSWWEKIAFWKPTVWEKPGLPAGLGDEGERRTYDDSDAPPIPGFQPTPSATNPAASQPTTRKSTYGEGQ